ncbi:MAG: protein adenylyltransferase SelO, partial [Rubritalea sp.]|uniref:protein adenylyltransferase SelO n=1 Tax=Rubritalea sp. TaxID=2109375 RepID=UPI003242F8C8
MPIIQFDNTYAQLPESFYSKLSPAQVPAPKLVRVNSDLAAKLSIDAYWLQSPEGLAIFSGNATAEGSEPLAQAYAGHQFGGYNPQLGDGRAILLGEVTGTDSRRYDIQLKGSGRTPYSRGGDGKAALGPVIREYILSEAMAALGVPTTRALAAVSTGETVVRQEGPLPGAVFTRVASSHIRVGTFQYIAARKDISELRALADHTIQRHYPSALESETPYIEFLNQVITAQADLIAHWMSFGFIHGVMNTDNTAISGETIDYGPCAFMDDFHPQCVFSSIDANARYSWGNQPNIALWNLTRFAETLLPLLADETEQATTIAQTALESFQEYFATLYMRHFRAKFGLPDTAADSLVQDGLSLLANQQIDFTLFFRKLTQVANGATKGDWLSLFTNQAEASDWFTGWETETTSAMKLEKMRTVNPIL